VIGGGTPVARPAEPARASAYETICDERTDRNAQAGAGEIVRLLEQDLFTLHRPTRCFRRIDCEQRGVPSGERSAFLLEMRRLEQFREDEHRRLLGDMLDLTQGTPEEQMVATLKAIGDRVPRIFRPVLRARAPFGDEPELVGTPDFLILDGDNYIIREVGYVVKADENHHPELLRQLEAYAWLFEANTLRPPAGMQYVNIDGEVIDVAHAGTAGVLDELRRVYEVRTAGLTMYEPVGENRCRLCRFREHCFETALADKDPAVLPAVDLSLARRLHELGIRSYAELPAAFTAETLAAVKRPFGSRMRSVGSKAKLILDQVRAFESGETLQRTQSELPTGNGYVVFDVLGLPEQVAASSRVYVWGIETPAPGAGSYRSSLAGPGFSGDREGWFGFLDNAAAVLNERGDLPFIHWSKFEKDRLLQYVDRWGDRDGIADRVARNLYDLRLAVRDAVAIPDTSYSIFTVEQRAGFKRTRSQQQSDEDVARYIRAVEARDEALRAETLDRAIERNREDLAASRAVLVWLQESAGAVEGESGPLACPEIPVDTVSGGV
jgi:predicted RecB family nuclease